MEVKEASAKYAELVEPSGDAVPFGYKPTDAGIIPVEWNSLSLADLCLKIQDGTHFSPRTGGHDYLYLTSKNVRFGFLDISTAAYVDAVQHEAIYKRCDVKQGDLLLTKDGANTGNAALNTLNDQFSLLSSVAFLRFDAKKHNAGYFLQQVLSTQGQRRMKDAMSGNAITRLTLEKIRKLIFPTAPLPEQNAIAEALSDADALIESLEQLIAKKRQIKQGTVQALLTGEQRLPGFKQDWLSKRLADVCDMKSGEAITSELIDDGSPYPCFGGNGLRGYVARYTHDGDFALIGRQGALCGNVVLAIGRFFASEHAIVVSPHVGTDVCWLALVLKRMSLNRYSESSAQPGLSVSKLLVLECVVPPHDEQAAIATILSDMDTELAELETRLAKTRQLKQGMMQELLTGRIRLV
jgi:type I restriction enzyme S subunit